MRIAENRKMKTAALCAALALIVAVCAVTFTGCAAEAKANAPEPSVQPSDTPTETVLPAVTTDVLTTPLTDLVPFEPQKIEQISAGTVSAGHHEGHHDGNYDRNRVGGGTITVESLGWDTFAWTCGGKTYVSTQHVGRSAYPDDYFLCIDNTEPYEEEPFTNVLGYDGVMVSYIGTVGSNGWATINDYYVFEENANGGVDVYLLARVYGVPYLRDMNGDGVNELVGTDGSQQAQIFFLRDGKLYEADIPALVSEHWKRWDEDNWMSHSFNFFGWSENHPQYMELQTYVPAVTGKGMETSLDATRHVYFDGANLLLNKPERHMTDHMLDDIQEMNVITDAAKALVKDICEEWSASYGEGWDDMYHALPEWDDYCVTGIECVYLTEENQLPGGRQVIVYQVQYEIHTPTPADVVLAGGTYVTEDGWVGGFWTPDAAYLVFQIQPDGSYKQLEHHIASDAFPGAPAFDGEMTLTLMWNGLLLPSEASGENLFYGAECSPLWFMDTLARYSESEQDAALTKLIDYVDSGDWYESEHLQLLVSAGFDYSEDGAKVAERLKKLMSASLAMPE